MEFGCLSTRIFIDWWLKEYCNKYRCQNWRPLQDCERVRGGRAALASLARLQEELQPGGGAVGGAEEGDREGRDLHPLQRRVRGGAHQQSLCHVG